MKSKMLKKAVVLQGLRQELEWWISDGHWAFSLDYRKGRIDSLKQAIHLVKMME